MGSLGQGSGMSSPLIIGLKIIRQPTKSEQSNHDCKTNVVPSNLESSCCHCLQKNQLDRGSKMITKREAIILHHMMSYDGWGHHMMGCGHHMMGFGHHMMGVAIILHHMMSYDG